VRADCGRHLGVKFGFRAVSGYLRAVFAAKASKNSPANEFFAALLAVKN